ncbi:cathepsin B-like cysteine proteinase isoform X2 [Bemisia tabaci]|uniref:cathepsin B-like cysteine proteinase isoform X2 n=1 Tax=Bemisia tabaci TaxID=7038 RepID=UPI003B28B15F
MTASPKICYFAGVLTFFGQFLVGYTVDVLSLEGVEWINSLQSTWQAEFKYPRTAPALVQNSMIPESDDTQGEIAELEFPINGRKEEDPGWISTVPNRFDARNYKPWKRCRRIISYVPDQGPSEFVGYGCQPYEMQPCQHFDISGDREKCSVARIDKAKCQNRCTNSKYTKSYSEDLRKVQSFEWLSTNETNIFQEIMTYGPVTAGFDFYEDFISYKKGVYKHIGGRYITHHKVKVIGWGIEKGEPYWLCINSWNKDWGLHGLFKISRNNAKVNFEYSFSAGWF